jgi:hypothetical protein
MFQSLFCRLSSPAFFCFIFFFLAKCVFSTNFSYSAVDVCYEATSFFPHLLNVLYLPPLPLSLPFPILYISPLCTFNIKSAKTAEARKKLFKNIQVGFSKCGGSGF